MGRRPKSDTAPPPVNGHPIIFQYKSLMVLGPTGAIINGQSAKGWELIAVTSGGFDPFSGRWQQASTVLYFKRLWRSPKDDLEEEVPEYEEFENEGSQETE